MIQYPMSIESSGITSDPPGQPGQRGQNSSLISYKQIQPNSSKKLSPFPFQYFADR